MIKKLAAMMLTLMALSLPGQAEARERVTAYVPQPIYAVKGDGFSLFYGAYRPVYYMPRPAYFHGKGHYKHYIKHSKKHYSRHQCRH